VQLPIPPSDDEKRLYLTQDKAFLYGFGSLSLLCLMTGMTLFSFSHPYFVFYFPFALLIFCYLTVSYFIGIFGHGFDYTAHLAYYAVGYQPWVDVYLPSCGEPLNVLANTYSYVKRMSYPFYRVWVLDDSGRPEVKELAERQGFGYMVRPDRPNLKKAGNIRAAFRVTEGELILILDADFCPRPDMLTEVVKYFKDPKIGLVQTPQYFKINKNDTPVQKGAAFVQELFYRLIQVSRDHFSAAICTGTCAVYRRSALQPFGGTAAVEYSEDLHTGFMLLSAGFRIKYLPINLSAGLCPDRISQFITQQYRWSMGSIGLMTSRKFWQTPLTVMQRLCYLSGATYYVATAIGVLMTPIPAILLANLRPDLVHWYSIIFSLPSFLFGTLYMALWSKLPFGIYALKARNLSYYSHLLAIKDRITGNMMGWIPTGIRVKNSKVTNVLWGCRLWTSISFLLIVTGAVRNYSHNFIPMLAFATLNLYIGISSTIDH
jgi:cellulose synthase/poly-beta-1,6-N-acetylglucosamine synthase-like glycosyltransferase